GGCHARLPVTTPHDERMHPPRGLSLRGSACAVQRAPPVTRRASAAFNELTVSANMPAVHPASKAAFDGIRRHSTTRTVSRSRSHMTLDSRMRAAAILALLIAPASGSVWAQGRHDVIRGRVTGDSGRAVRGANVATTRAPDRAVKTTTTDANGQFVI